MKIRELELKAFGPFSERTLDLTLLSPAGGAPGSGADAPGSKGEPPGLHIIFGPNEAGKSSALRALMALLYGFPERTGDNFRHPNDQLMVGGRLQLADGRELHLYRRKKRKGDLLDGDGNILAPSALAPFLHGIEADLFSSLYGIDHRTLVAGGQEILAQKGELGQALFAAGTGMSSLKWVLDSLEAEAEELFKDRGSKQKISAGVRRYQELRKKVKEKSLPPAKLEEHRRKLEQAEADYASLEEESRQQRAELQRLERLDKAIPELARLRHLQEERQGLGGLGEEVVLLPLTFAGQLRQVQQRMRDARIKMAADEEGMQKLGERKQQYSFDPQVLEHAQQIEDLYQRLDRYRKDLQDCGTREGERRLHMRQAESYAKQLRPGLSPGEAEALLRPVLNRERVVQELISRHGVLAQQREDATGRRDDAERRIAEIGQELAQLPAFVDDAPLARGVGLARREGDIDGQIRVLRTEVEGYRRACDGALGRLGLWTGDLAGLMVLPLPLPPTLAHHKGLMDRLEDERRLVGEERRRAKGELEEAQTLLQGLQSGGEVPGEADLLAVRERRQHGWSLLRRRWVDGEEVGIEWDEYEPGVPVHEAYERSVEQADRVADRLRREAERVARVATQRSRMEALQGKLGELRDKEEEELNPRQEVLLRNWEAEWEGTGIVPLSPDEMGAWLGEVEKLRMRASALADKEGALAALVERRRERRSALLGELDRMREGAKLTGSGGALHPQDEVGEGSELAPVSMDAEALLEKLETRERVRSALEAELKLCKGQLDKAGDQVDRIQKDREVWADAWREALSGFRAGNSSGTPAETQALPAPGEAQVLLDAVRKCLESLDKARELQRRIVGIRRDTERFTLDVAKLVERLAPGLKNEPPDQGVLQLKGMLDGARQNSELTRRSREDMEKLRGEVEQSAKEIEIVREELDGLLAMARCGEEAELEKAMGRSDAYQRLTEQISGVESALATITAGVPLEELAAQAEQVDMDDLPGRIETLRRYVEKDLNSRIKDALSRRGEEKRELDLMFDDSEAAEAAEEMERVGAAVRRNVGQYTRLKVAAAVLREEMERYRKEHEDPMLRIASAVFSALTLGSFAGLRADLDDGGKPVLVGVRRGGERVTVEGMSDGSCDQLYLALRLAALQVRVAKGEHMPFIVDDILINFDDARSEATLRSLASLADRNQVLLFTHHRAVADAASSLASTEAAPVRLHRL